MKADRAQISFWSVSTNTSLQSVLDDPECPPLLHQALTGFLSWQARNMTPVEKTLRSPRLAPQWAAALLALGATITENGQDKPLESLPQRKTVGEPATLRVRVGGEIKWGEASVARTPADEPIVTAIAVVELDHSTDSGQGGVVRQARVALSGVWPEPVRLAKAPVQLTGGPLDEERIQAVAEAVGEEVTPQGDFRGSEEYRRAMAGVLTRRALAACLHQEAGNE